MMCYWHVKRSLYVVRSVKHIKKWPALISINLCGFDVPLCNYAVLRSLLIAKKQSAKHALKCREHFERTLVRSEGRSAGGA